MKVYLAAQYSRREELRAYVTALASIGIDSTARWITETAPMAVGGATGTGHDDPNYISDMAQRDVVDIDQADMLLLFTNGPETRIVRGAHHFESGYAYGKGIVVRTIGPRDNVFHYLPNVYNFPTWEAAYAQLLEDRKLEEAILGY